MIPSPAGCYRNINPNFKLTFDGINGPKSGHIFVKLIKFKYLHI